VWCSLRQRVLIVCTALRTSLTFRELAAVFDISKSAAHRVTAILVPQLAALAAADGRHDRRSSRVIDRTLVPTVTTRGWRGRRTTVGSVTRRCWCDVAASS
jgi:hypothetical protein